MADKNEEYVSLRSEVLDYWKHQEQLLYATGGLFGGALVILAQVKDKEISKPLVAEVSLGLCVSVSVIFFIYLILIKCILNYDKINRIGAYLRVFHDNDKYNGDEYGSWHYV